MELGPEARKQIVLKYKEKLKALLTEHEIKASTSEHMMLLVELVKVVEDDIHKTHKDWLE